MKDKLLPYILVICISSFSQRILAETISIKDGKCSGEFLKLKEIQDSGIPVSILKFATPCIVGDFNGDGNLDVALIPFVQLPKVRNMVKSHWRVIFLILDKQKAISKVLVVPKKLQNSLSLFPKTHSEQELAQLKGYKCPYQNKFEGVVARGEGDSTHIFLIDEFQNVKTFECASEDH